MIRDLNPTPVRCWTYKGLHGYKTSVELLKKLDHTSLSAAAYWKDNVLAYKNEVSEHHYEVSPCNAMQTLVREHRNLSFHCKVVAYPCWKEIK